MASRPRNRAFRIVSNRYPPFDWAGAQRWGSRWVSPGRWVVHAAETWSLAVLENLVHWQTAALPPGLVYVTIDIPPDVTQRSIDRDRINPNTEADYARTRLVGDAWYDSGDSAVLWVPSVASQFEANVLFNQRHSDFGKLQVSDPAPAWLDPRLRGA